MAYKKTNQRDFSEKRLTETLKYRQTSIRQMCALDGGLGWSDKTVRRAKKLGTINAETLDAIAQFLDVDPDYLSGKYDLLIERIREEYNNEQMAQALLVQLTPDRFPYLLSQHTDVMYDRYRESVLALHGISMRQFSQLPIEVQKQFEYELDVAVTSVISKYFTQDASGREGLPDLNKLQSRIAGRPSAESETINSKMLCASLEELNKKTLR